MKKFLLLLTALCAVLSYSNAQTLTAPNLGTARDFAVLGNTSVVSTGSSVIYGDLGTSPGTLVTGFPTGRVLGDTERGTVPAATAKTDVMRVYNELGQLTVTRNLTGQTLGEGFTTGAAAVRGTTLNRGVYRFDGNARISGRLKFDGQGNPNSVFVIQVNGDLIIDPGSAINVFNASANNIYFRVTGNITIGSGGLLGTPSALAGNMLVQNNALLSIGSTLVGRVLSTTGDVTLNNNNISLPEPVTSGTIGDGGGGAASLSITKSVNGSVFTIGDNVVYTITVTNSGSAEATNVTVEDKLPTGLTFVPPAAADRGTYDAVTGIWTIGTLPANQTATLRITAKTTVLGEITNIAVIGGGGGTDEATICVRPARPNVTGVQEVCAGGTTSFTVSNISAGVTSLAIVVPANSGITVTSQTLSSFTVSVSNTATAGTYPITVVAVAAGNCQNSQAFPIDLTVRTAPGTPVISSPQGPLCAGSTYQYSVTQQGGATYKWTVSGAGWRIVGADTGTQVQVQAGTEAGRITVMATNACGTATASTPDVTPNPVPGTPEILDNSGPCTGLTYAISRPVAGVTYTWTAPQGFTFTDNSTTTTGTTVTLKSPNANAVGTLTVRASFGTGVTCPSNEASIEVQAAKAGTEIVVPTVFSPNNDGINDSFVIRNLLNYPDNDLTIYNRWGNEIYKTVSYKNDWQATGLEEATYFYVLRVRGCDGKDKIFRGPVQVVR